MWIVAATCDGQQLGDWEVALGYFGRLSVIVLGKYLFPWVPLEPRL